MRSLYNLLQVSNYDSMEDVQTDFTNNYLTVEKFAEHNNMSYDEAYKLIEYSRRMNNQKAARRFKAFLGEKK